MYGLIYKFTNTINGKIYVGKTTQLLERRVSQHKSRKDSVIGQAIHKHGWENFSVEVLEECGTKEKLNEREIFWIAELNCKKPNGYNRSDGGDGCTGYSHLDETRAKISAAGKGIPKSPEHRAKIAASERGKKQTPETKAKLSEKRRGETPYKNLLAEISSKRITYATLAKLLGLGHQTFSDKMRDKQRFTTEQIAKLVEIFQKPAEYLMARDDGLAATKTEEERCAKISSTLRQNSPYKNLLIEMDKHQMTYNQLANLMGLLSSASISMKMHGKQNFTPEQVAKLVELFDKPAEYLMARAEV